MRAIEEVIDVAPGFEANVLAETGVNLVKHVHVQPSQCYPSLVGYNQHLESSIIESADRQSHLRQDSKLLGCLYIAATERLGVDCPISVEERSAWML